jgi:ATP-dependent Clp protease ATP-binding subunit ClpA
MTEDRRRKRAIRARMAQTGEKYTEAMRAVGSGGSDTNEVPRVAAAWPDDLLGWFTDQAYNAILLGEDEARMLSQSVVEPEHLLLAVARFGNVQRLLAGDGVTAGNIHGALVRTGGFGTQLVLGPLPRAQASEAVLRRAVASAHERGVRGPSTEHVLLALAGEPTAAALLGEVGVLDATALVDAAYPVTRPAVDARVVQRRARERAAHVRRPPSPGPMPPVFERFTAEARRAVEVAVEQARSLESPYVAPAHLLLGLLCVEEGVIASVRVRHQRQFAAAIARAVDIMAEFASRATGIFTPPARRLLAEEVLKIADRLGHRSLGTGHLFLAVLESPDADTAEILAALPDPQRVITELIEGLPGTEHA